MDERAQMRLGVMKTLAQFRQRYGLVVLADGMQDMRKVRTGLVTVKLGRIAGRAQNGRQQQVHIADAAAVGIDVIAKTVSDGIAKAECEIRRV